MKKMIFQSTLPAFTFVLTSLIKTSAEVVNTSKQIITAELGQTPRSDQLLASPFLILGCALGLNLIRTCKTIFTTRYNNINSTGFKKAHKAYVESSITLVVSGACLGGIISLSSSIEDKIYYPLAVPIYLHSFFDILLGFISCIDRQIGNNHLWALDLLLISIGIAKFLIFNMPYACYTILPGIIVPKEAFYATGALTLTLQQGINAFSLFRTNYPARTSALEENLIVQPNPLQ